MTNKTHKAEIAIFATGCFWNPELYFSKLPGVVKTRVGYIDGDPKIKKPTYEQVCSHSTGFAEAIEVTFDPKKISYKKLLEGFWKIHDSTQMNRQGPDIGDQYRSAIYYTTKEQKVEIDFSLKVEQKKLGSKKIVTQIKKAPTFFPAEEYHQKYLEKRGLKTCHI